LICGALVETGGGVVPEPVVLGSVEPELSEPPHPASQGTIASPARSHPCRIVIIKSQERTWHQDRNKRSASTSSVKRDVNAAPAVKRPYRRIAGSMATWCSLRPL
jgi:hypothetical protein